MTDCKHNWHFIEGSERLRCERCKQEVGPWTTEHLTVPAGTGYALANTTPSYTFVLHNADGKIGTLDFNGPEMVFTGDADKSAQVFFDHVGKYFDQRLKAERQKELDACCDLLEGMHACSTGSHNYYLHAAVELRRLRKGTP